MNLQYYLVKKFESWQPQAPEVVARSKYDVTLSWCHDQDEWQFLEDDLLYRVERKEKMPPWVVVYSGGKTNQRIDNLAPCSPHKFRLKVILKASAVPHLAERVIQYYGTENNVFKKMNNSEEVEDNNGKIRPNVEAHNAGDARTKWVSNKIDINVNESGDKSRDANFYQPTELRREERKRKWLESEWSEETCTSTDSDGTSSSCFCMAVRGGYLKQVQIMLEERPALIGIINSTNGFTPLATAVRKGDINTVRYLLTAGAEIDQRSSTGQTPLHLAVLSGHAAIVDLLLEKGAKFHARDINDLRVEHYAVDSCNLDMVKLILDKGGDVEVKDNKGWTPLFRAACQGATSAMIEELVVRGSDIEVTDNAGLTLTSAARLLNNRHGQERDSVLRLVDSQYPHEKALANFTKLTKKISSVHTLVKP